MRAYLWWSSFLIVCAVIGTIGLVGLYEAKERRDYYYGTRVRSGLNAAVVTASTNFSAVLDLT